MKISYAIPVCNEHSELNKLLNFLITHKRSCDEIVVQCDLGNTTKEVYEVIDNFSDKIKITHYALKNDFASFKNNLKKNCIGEWIFQIDADELLHEWLIKNLPTILIDNPEIDLFYIPRINTVSGLTQDHIKKWNWNINEKGWINFPDYQTRIIQNNPKICWVGKVHEVIHGHRNHAMLPTDEEYCIIHQKNIVRQEFQNKMYELI